MTMFAESSAPAKIILCGEHAVVYGQPAIAIPLPTIRAIARAFAPKSFGQKLRILAHDVGEEFSFTDLKDFDRNNPLLLAANLFFALNKMDIPDLTVDITSMIPVASGLGSGAAVTTAFVRVLAKVTERPIDDNDLNKIVYSVEKIHHGTPSGIDNTVIVYEHPVYFVRNQSIEKFAFGNPMTFVIADTGIGAETHLAVADVRTLYDANIQKISSIINEIGHIVKGVRQAISSGDNKKIGQLMTQNHKLLQELTVSSSELDNLVETALSCGAIGAKLSGGGRGGNMIALVDNLNTVHIKDKLLKAGARKVFEVSVGNH
ncbi:MAG: mevalonate kinase [Anaerolineae bacterium]